MIDDPSLTIAGRVLRHAFRGHDLVVAVAGAARGAGEVFSMVAYYEPGGISVLSLETEIALKPNIIRSRLVELEDGGLVRRTHCIGSNQYLWSLTADGQAAAVDLAVRISTHIDAAQKDLNTLLPPHVKTEKSGIDE